MGLSVVPLHGISSEKHPSLSKHTSAPVSQFIQMKTKDVASVCRRLTPVFMVHKVSVSFEIFIGTYCFYFATMWQFFTESQLNLFGSYHIPPQKGSLKVLQSIKSTSEIIKQNILQQNTNQTLSVKHLNYTNIYFNGDSNLRYIPQLPIYLYIYIYVCVCVICL